MKRRVVVVAAFAALVVGLGCAVWLLLQQADSPLALKLVRQRIENGTPVAYFRLAGCFGRRLQIGEIEQLTGHQVLQWADLLAVFRDPKTAGRRELRLVAPKDVQSWKLRVTVYMEPGSLVERFNLALGQWRTLRANKYSATKALKEIWTTPVYSQSQIVESNPVTNNVSLLEAQNR